jgi:hypothetical protein
MPVSIKSKQRHEAGFTAIPHISVLILIFLHRPLNLAGTETSGADTKLHGSAVNQRVNGLQIRLPDFLRPNMRMADLHAHRFSFSTNITFEGQRLHLLLADYQTILSKKTSHCNIQIFM